LTGAAAARLYDDHVDAVHDLIARRVGPDVAPLVTAEAFEIALRTWDDFDRVRGTERHFVFGTATAALRNYSAQEREHLLGLKAPSDSGRDINDPLVSSGEEPNRPRVVDHSANRDLHAFDEAARSVADPDGVTERTMEALVDLDPEDRDMLLLSLWESCSQSAIAEVVGLSVGSVRSSLGRIRREMKAAVEGSTR
jgi:RNA polymerase sigma-70 factor (ECF subfamily)